MLFTRIYDEDLAQASYFIGCQATGEAVVVDPRRTTSGLPERGREQRHDDRRGDRDAHPRRLPLRLKGAGGGNGDPLYLSDEGTPTGSTASRARSSTTETRSGWQRDA